MYVHNYVCLLHFAIIRVFHTVYVLPNMWTSAVLEQLHTYGVEQ